MNIVLTLIGAALGGYLMGSLPIGYVLVHLFKGVDLRGEGSGRTGGTNAMRAGGPWIGALTGLGDLAKGAGTIWIIRAVGVRSGASPLGRGSWRCSCGHGTQLVRLSGLEGRRWDRTEYWRRNRPLAGLWACCGPGRNGRPVWHWIRLCGLDKRSYCHPAGTADQSCAGSWSLAPPDLWCFDGRRCLCCLAAQYQATGSGH